MVRLVLAALLLVGLTSASALAQTTRVVAGNGTAAFAGDGSPAPFGSISNPVGIHGDASGQIWIADTGNHAVRRVTASWDTIVTFAGTGGTPGYTGDGAAATSATLNGPTDVFRDASGVLWIADTGNHVIRRVTTAGVISTVAGTGTAGFSGDGSAATSATLDSPSGVYVTSGGIIYIADRGNHRIRRVDASGTITTFAGTGDDEFSGDGGAATDAALNRPTDVYIDTAGVLYIADTNNHRIRAVATDSTISTVAGTGSAGFSGDGGIATEARLAFPRAVFTDTSGVLYIADRFNHRIRRVDTGGNITTLAGDGVLQSTGTGGAVNLARLANPSGVWLHDDRHLFISEGAAHRVRRAHDDNIHALTDTTTVGRGGEVQILTAAFTGDGSTAVKGLRLTVSDLSTVSGIDTSDFVDFRLYESPDSLFSSTDTLLASVLAADITLGQSFTVQTTTSPVPASGQRRFYLVTARLANDAVEGRSFRVAFPTGGLSTTIGAHAMRRLASDTDRVTIDVVATRLVFTTQPDGVIANNPLITQPVLEAIDDLGFIDSDFTETVTLTLSGGSGTLLQNTTTAVAGVARFSNVAYATSTDQESFALVADDEVGGAEGDLPSVTSNMLTANTENDPPVVSAFNFNIDEDDSVTVPIRSIVSDVDDSLSSLTLTFEASNTQTSFDGTDLVIRPNPNFAGIDTLIITAEDPFGALSSDISILTVKQINDAPVLTPLGRRSVDEDDTVRVDMRAQIDDVETPFESLRWIINPSPGLQVSLSKSSGILTAWTTPDSAGVFTLRLVGIDESNASDASVDTIEFVAVNDLPVLDLPTTLELARDSTDVIELRPLVTDVEHDAELIEFQLGEALGVSGTVDDDRLTVTADSDFTGAAYLVVVATDPDGGVGTDTLHVNVFSGEPQPPQFAAIPDQTVEAGDSLWIDLRGLVSDPDHDVDQLTLTSSAPAIGSAAVLGDSLLVVTDGIEAYSVELVLTATDPDGLQDEAPVTIDVTAVPVVFSSLPDSLVIDIDGGELRLDSYVSAGVDPATVEWTISGSGAIDLILDVDTRIITILPVDGSRDGGQIWIRGTNAKRSDADSVDIVVANFAPVVELPDIFVGAGESAQLLLDDFVSDDDDVSLLTWDATPLDAGLTVSINQAVRALTLSAASTASGDLRIAVTATDEQLAAGLDTIVVSVRTTEEPGDTTIVDTSGTNVAPVVGAFSQLTFQIGSVATVRLDDFVTDDDPIEQIRWSAEAGAGVSTSISDERVLSVESLADFDGTTSVRLTATDLFGGRDSGTLVVTVQPLVEAPREGDFDANGQIDLDDFFNLVDHLGLSVFAPGFDRRFDLDGDGRVGFDDFFLFVDLYERERLRR